MFLFVVMMYQLMKLMFSVKNILSVMHFSFLKIKDFLNTSFFISFFIFYLKKMSHHSFISWKLCLFDSFFIYFALIFNCHLYSSADVILVSLAFPNILIMINQISNSFSSWVFEIII